MPATPSRAPTECAAIPAGTHSSNVGARCRIRAPACTSESRRRGVRRIGRDEGGVDVTESVSALRWMQCRARCGDALPERLEGSLAHAERRVPGDGGGRDACQVAPETQHRRAGEKRPRTVSILMRPALQISHRERDDARRQPAVAVRGVHVGARRIGCPDRVGAVRVSGRCHETFSSRGGRPPGARPTPPNTPAPTPEV